jgi:hypothetical protein
MKFLKRGHESDNEFLSGRVDPKALLSSLCILPSSLVATSLLETITRYQWACR